MERLTKRDIDGCFIHPWSFNGVNGSYDIWDEDLLEKQIDRLAAYEDTGLEPEDLKSTVDIDYVRIMELLKADKDGRLVVLPVPKGTKIFRVVDIPEHTCSGRMRGHSFPASKRIYKGVMQWEDGPNFGKTVFLTREEAEAALAGKGGSNE